MMLIRLFSFCYNLWIQNNGSSALAAVGACAALTNVFICIALGGGVGAGVLVSRYLGSRDYSKMKTIVSTSLISFLILSILLGVFGFCFSHSMMSLLQTPADILKEAVLYLRVYFVGFPFLFMYNILSTMFTSIGESKIPCAMRVARAAPNTPRPSPATIQRSINIFKTEENIKSPSGIFDSPIDVNIVERILYINRNGKPTK